MRSLKVTFETPCGDGHKCHVTQSIRAEEARQVAEDLRKRGLTPMQVMLYFVAMGNTMLQVQAVLGEIVQEADKACA